MILNICQSCQVLSDLEPILEPIVHYTLEISFPIFRENVFKQYRKNTRNLEKCILKCTPYFAEFKDLYLPPFYKLEKRQLNFKISSERLIIIIIVFVNKFTAEILIPLILGTTPCCGGPLFVLQVESG